MELVSIFNTMRLHIVNMAILLCISFPYAKTYRIQPPDGLTDAAASHLQPGDTLYLEGGNYTPKASFWFSGSGTAAAPIVIRGDSLQPTVIDGSGTADENPTSVVGIGGGASYVILEYLEVENSQLQGILVWHGSHITIQHCTVHHSKQHGIGIWGDATLASWYNDFLVADNIVYDNSQINNPTGQMINAWAVGIAAHQVSGARFLRNHVYHNFGEGINQFLCKNGEVSHNVVNDNFSMNIYTDNDSNMLYDGNFVYNTGTTDTYRNGVPAYGIGLARETLDGGTLPLQDLVYRNNIVIGGYIPFHYGNYQHAGGLQNVLIENNLFVDGIESVVNIDPDDGHHNIQFMHNLVYKRKQSATKNLTSGTDIAAIVWTENAFFPQIPLGTSGSGNATFTPSFTSTVDTIAASWAPPAGADICNFAGSFPFPTMDYHLDLRQERRDLGPILCSDPAARNLRPMSHLNAAEIIGKGQLFDLLGRRE